MSNKIKARGLMVESKNSKFVTTDFERRELKDNDILIEIKYAGICHSDIHVVKSEWKEEKYPIIPGHEIAGVVVQIGKNVKKFKVGDNAGVGCLVNSCRECENCKMGYEQDCPKLVLTFAGYDHYNDNEYTKGGYSNYIVVDQDFAIKIKKGVPLEYIAPLLCAGITTYSPIVFSNVKKGSKVAIAGFGGLGVMALKYAKAFGAQTYVIARNRRKEDVAKELGAIKLYDSLDSIDEKFDLIISTIPNAFDVIKFTSFLKYGGELAILGLPPANQNWSMNPGNLLWKQHRKIYASMIGGIKLTQEMVDFSIEHEIFPEIEIISASEVDDAYEKLTSGKANFRYVIDISTLK